MKQLPLVLAYDNGSIRDYETVVPFNTPMTLIVGSGSAVLADRAGSTLSQQGLPLQISPADFQAMPLPFAPLARMFPRAKAKMVHVYAAGIQ